MKIAKLLFGVAVFTTQLGSLSGESVTTAWFGTQDHWNPTQSRRELNGNEFYFLPRGTSCPSENVIKTVDECKEAGQLFQGKLRDGTAPVSGQWGHIPGGCSIFIDDLAIHFDTDFTVNFNDGEFCPVCKEVQPRSSDSLFLPLGVPGCKGIGKKITTAEACTAAAVQVGGRLRNGQTAEIGTWGHVPCGCSIFFLDGATHFNTNLDDCTQDGTFYPVCEKAETTTATKSTFLPIGVEGCPATRGITTEAECREAGVAFGALLRDTVNPAIGTWGWVPCGCSIFHEDGALHFDTDPESCLQDRHFTPLCRLPPPPAPEQYFFDYSLENMVFGAFDEGNADIETLSYAAGGLVKNCASGSTTTDTVNMVWTVGNTQSLTSTKSFTSSFTAGVTAGVSVTVEAEAGAVFAKASVAVTASLEISTEFGSEKTEEESKSMEQSNEIQFSFSTTVQVDPQTCVQYTLQSDISKEPVQIPYTADVHLEVFGVKVNDIGEKEKGEKIEDLSKLNEIVEMLEGYEASVDANLKVIVYETDGFVTGKYASQSNTLTSNCDACVTPTAPAPTPTAPAPTPTAPAPTPTAPAPTPTAPAPTPTAPAPTPTAPAPTPTAPAPTPTAPAPTPTAPAPTPTAPAPTPTAPAPTPTAPAPTPTASAPTPTAPPESGLFGLCFSGRSTVQVQGKGETPISQLRIGESILTGDGSFQKVYAFGHKDHTSKMEYLQIRTEGVAKNRRPLEITADHLIGKYDEITMKTQFVAAEDLKVGNLVIDEQGAPTKIESIGLVKSQGLYAPLTPAGTLVVNGIVASSYAVPPSMVKTGVSGQMLHLIQHAAVAPYRAFCALTGGCENETYDESTGYSPYTMFWHRLDQLLMSLFHPILQSAIMVFAAVPLAVVGQLLVSSTSTMVVHLAAAVLGFFILRKKINNDNNVTKKPIKQLS